ncbi:MAG: hypothetical protein FWG09_07540, partial [Synergistaceae bacterium]|nr:hypothetical protein [Synergistaceae bacterium]
RSRITGVIPRELTPTGERVINRTSPGHIGEIEWWASQIGPGTRAVIAENSAVDPEFQPIPAQIIGPTMAVWTNCRPDHEEVWGHGEKAARRALLRGIPQGIPVACGVDADTETKALLESRGNKILPPVPLPETFGYDYDHACAYENEKLPLHLRENIELASAVCCAVGFSLETSLRVMASLPPDIADFRIINHGDRQLAAAFSANDPVSTSRLFDSTNWKPEETTLLYNHRADRSARLTSFLPWINSLPWKRRVFTRGPSQFSNVLNAFSLPAAVVWNDDIRDADSFLSFWEGGNGNENGKKIFGCGNAAGWPLDFLLRFSIRQEKG